MKYLTSFFLIASVFTGLHFSIAPNQVDLSAEALANATDPGGGDGYVRAMKSNVAKLDAEISDGALAQVLANFDRIATTEETKWLPYYYVAFSSASLAYREKDLDQVDVWCDRAEAALNKAAALEHDASEIAVARAFIDYARIKVDFMSRGFTYSRQAMRNLAAAVQANPENPRAYSLMAQHYMNVPAQLGGSKEKGCEYNELAVQYFQREREASAGQISIEPHWGYGDVIAVRNNLCGAMAQTDK